jgi:hypothetical protein
MRDQFAALEDHIGDVEAGLNKRIDGVERRLKGLI